MKAENQNPQCRACQSQGLAQNSDAIHFVSPHNGMLQTKG